MRFHGVSAGVHLTNQTVAETVLREAEAFLPGIEVETGVRVRCYYRIEERAPGNIELFQGPRRIAASGNQSDIVRQMCSHLQTRIAENADEAVFVHAGVAAWKGRALVLPGRSHAGKSTLIAALLARGAEYYSDEYMILDAEGRIHPFACPLKLRGNRENPPRRIMPDRGAQRRDPLSPGLLLFLKYHPAGEWEVQKLTPGQAVLRLLRNAVSARRNPAATLRAARLAADAAPAFQGRRGDAGRAVDEVFELYERSC